MNGFEQKPYIAIAKGNKSIFRKVSARAPDRSHRGRCISKLRTTPVISLGIGIEIRNGGRIKLQCKLYIPNIQHPEITLGLSATWKGAAASRSRSESK